jgi:hypothetical protein
MNEWDAEQTKKLVLSDALKVIARARRENRLEWGENSEVVYTDKCGKKETRNIEDMPDWFFKLTGTTFQVYSLCGDITNPIRDIFIKVLDSTPNEIDIESIQNNIDAELDELVKQAKAQKRDI